MFPREVIRTIGRAGLLGLPYPEEDGGAAQPYEVYLQVLEILASRWLAVAEAVSVHTLACFPVAAYGSEAAAQACCPTCSAASCSAPTACPSRRAVPTPAR